MKQGIATREGHLTHGGAELRGLLVIERREERGAPQNVVHEFLSYVACTVGDGCFPPPILPDGPNSVISHSDTSLPHLRHNPTGRGPIGGRSDGSGADVSVGL
ncbi:hypothetical protein GCM10010431_43220 [Streptomyces kunmingensis]